MVSDLNYQQARRRMVREQLIPWGISDPRVLAAMEKIPREHFVAKGMHDQAYADHPLSIGQGQTISQPLIVAQMTQALELVGTERILEIGTGSGYQTAILLELGKEVYSIERLKDLSQKARKKLFQLGYDHFHLRVGDGTLGWPEAAPFDAILVTAASPKIPPAYGEQLAEKGRLVIPCGPSDGQVLYLFRKTEGKLVRSELGLCRFVKLIGEFGWQNEN